MKKTIRQLSEKRDRFNEKLKVRLESLSPKSKLNVILLLMAAYLIITIIVLAGIVRERNNDTLRIRHIEPVPIIDTPLKIHDKNDSAYSFQPENKNLVNKYANGYRN